jgi:quinol-cytochrome oxidoreductase complex cytochrome b subunit
MYRCFNYAYVSIAQGYLLLIVFVIQVVTGILLLMVYRVTGD